MLNYLDAGSHSDIAYAAHQCARFAAECEYSHLLASSVTSPNQKSNTSPKRKTKQEQKNDRKTRRIKQTQYYDIQDSHKIHRKQTD